jgi:hypothetical protein
MKRLYRLPMLALLALSFVAVGCDSGEDEPTDAEFFVGSHTVVKLEDNVGTGSQRDLTSQVICATANAGPTQTNPCTVNSIKLMFNQDGTYSIMVDYTNTVNAAPASAGGRADVTITGTNSGTTQAYTVNEASKTITLRIPGLATPVQVSYAMTSSNQTQLTVPSVVFNNIFGTTLYQGNVRITVQK